MSDYVLRDRAGTDVASPTKTTPNGKEKERSDDGRGPQSPTSPTGKTHQRFVLVDPVALKYASPVYEVMFLQTEVVV